MLCSFDFVQKLKDTSNTKVIAQHNDRYYCHILKESAVKKVQKLLQWIYQHTKFIIFSPKPIDSNITIKMCCHPKSADRNYIKSHFRSRGLCIYNTNIDYSDLNLSKVSICFVDALPEQGRASDYLCVTEHRCW